MASIQITQGNGTQVGTDIVSSVNYQQIKLVDGTLGSTLGIPGDSTNGLFVNVKAMPALATGTNAIGSITNTSFVVTQLTGTNLHTVIDSGTVSVGASTNYIGKVRLTDGTNDTTLRSLTNSKSLDVSIVDATGNQITSFGGGIQYTTGAAQATPIGTMSLGWDGTNVKALPLDASGYLKVNVVAGGASGGTSSTFGAVYPTTGTAVGFSDGVNMRAAYVAAFHNGDNQVPASSQYGLLTGGVAQILNPSGTLDRQRGTGFDGIPAVGIATGTQQLAGNALTTTFNATVTGNVNAQSVLVVSSANVKIGEIVLTQDNIEYVEITAILDATHITGIFKNNHASGQTLTWFHYNQARDATVGDQVGGVGISPSATYLYNNINNNFEFDRSAAGELDGATGRGTAVAAEYEYNGGGPLNNVGIESGLNFDRARNLQGKGTGSSTLNGATSAGATSIIINAVLALSPGEQIVIDRGTGTAESAYVALNYTAGTLTATLQSALQFAHSNGATIEWDAFSYNGPGLNGFNAIGVGIEEEALFNPVDNKFYIERAATQDGVSANNVVIESVGLWNGATMDRLKGDTTNGAYVNVKAMIPLPTGANAIGSITNTSFIANQSIGTNLHTVVDSGFISPQASVTSQALNMYRNPVLSNTAIAVKVSSGRIYAIHFYNPNSTDIFIQFYDLAQGGVTVGTTTPSWTWWVAAGGAIDDVLEIPIPGNNALTIAATTTITGGTAPTTGILTNIGFI